ncbi:MAG: hypothetical protein K0R08_1208 [Solimicrobium sp.]|jgi:hypothetical protein|nr:hypothetical protein [Solimicrobium sp.]
MVLIVRPIWALYSTLTPKYDFTLTLLASNQQYVPTSRNELQYAH